MHLFTHFNRKHWFTFWKLRFPMWFEYFGYQSPIFLITIQDFETKSFLWYFWMKKKTNDFVKWVKRPYFVNLIVIFILVSYMQLDQLLPILASSIFLLTPAQFNVNSACCLFNLSSFVRRASPSSFLSSKSLSNGVLPRSPHFCRNLWLSIRRLSLAFLVRDKMSLFCKNETIYRHVQFTSHYRLVIK